MKGFWGKGYSSEKIQPENTILRIKQDFYDDRAKEIRGWITASLVLSISLSILNSLVSFDHMRSSQVIFKAVCNALMVILIFLSHHTNDMRFVRLSFAILIFKDVTDIFMLKKEELLEDIAKKGSSLAVHIVMNTCTISFNLIYSNKNDKVQ